MRSLPDEMRKGVRREAAHRNSFDRIRREAVTIRRHRAEKISRQRKADHLPPPIWQQLIQTRNTRGDVVNGSGRLSRGEKRLIVRQMNVAGDPLELDKVGLFKGAADAERSGGAGRATAEKGKIKTTFYVIFNLIANLSIPQW